MVTTLKFNNKIEFILGSTKQPQRWPQFLSGIAATTIWLHPGWSTLSLLPFFKTFYGWVMLVTFGTIQRINFFMLIPRAS